MYVKVVFRDRRGPIKMNSAFAGLPYAFAPEITQTSSKHQILSLTVKKGKKKHMLRISP